MIYYRAITKTIAKDSFVIINHEYGKSGKRMHVEEFYKGDKQHVIGVYHLKDRKNLLSQVLFANVPEGFQEISLEKITHDTFIAKTSRTNAVEVENQVIKGRYR